MTARAPQHPDVEPVTTGVDDMTAVLKLQREMSSSRPKMMIHAPKDTKQCEFDVAMHRGHIGLMSMMLESAHGITNTRLLNPVADDDEHYSEEWYRGCCIIACAVAHDIKGLCDLLTRNTVVPVVADENNQTALHIAITMHDLCSISALVVHGFLTHLVLHIDTVSSPVEHTLLCARLPPTDVFALVHLLATHGSPVVNPRGRISNDPPLICAAKRHMPDVVRLLIVLGESDFGLHDGEPVGRVMERLLQNETPTK